VINFIDRKHGREAISYPDAEYQHECARDPLKPNLRPFILYQEQVNADCSGNVGLIQLGGCDLLRRAMGKEKRDENGQAT